jgi:hypothetical protein
MEQSGENGGTREEPMKRAIFSTATALLIGFVAVGCDDDGQGIVDPNVRGPTGSLTIVTSTTGNLPAVAFAEYTCNIDGERGAGVGPNETHVHALAAGTHVVEMVDVPANCAVQGENPRIVQVAEGADVRVEFEITCQ